MTPPAGGCAGRITHLETIQGMARAADDDGGCNSHLLPDLRACAMAAIATSQPIVEHDEPTPELVEHYTPRSPLRGIMLAAPFGVAFWALIISLVRLVLP
jgi:hypothetical protein